MAGLNLFYGDASPSGRMASKLAGVVPAPSDNLSDWKQTFDLLARKYPERRITRVLSWYCKHHTDSEVPVVASAKSFCRLFGDLENLMGTTRPDPPGLKGLADEFLDIFAWPFGADRFVPGAVRNSYLNYEKFTDRLYAIRPRLDDHHRRLLDHLDDVLFYDTRDFLRLWFEETSRELCSWRNFRPNENWLTFSPDSPRLEHLACSHAYDWCCDSAGWFEIAHAITGALCL